MQLEFDLAVGDVIHVGDHTVMIVEIHDQEVTVKICSPTGSEPVDDRAPQTLPTRPR